MKPQRVAALVIGCLLAIPAIALLFGGLGLGAAYAASRANDGFLQMTLRPIDTQTTAITTEHLTLTDPVFARDSINDRLRTTLRLQVTGSPGTRPVFIGIAPAVSVDSYLSGVSHAQLTRLDNRRPVYRTITGTSGVAAPTAQKFWVASASGQGTQVLTWKAEAGRWSIVVMNADGSAGVAGAATVGVHVDYLLPVAIGVGVSGLVLLIAAVILIVVGATGQPAGVRSEQLAPVGAPVAGSYPLTLTATLDPRLSRWQWIVKWFLAIPHFIVLAVLWVVFAVVTFVAGFAILFTGRYPRSLFDLNVGILRWTWRVSYYAGSGGLGTDRYPPFTLATTGDYPAELSVAYPERLSRGLVLVKWWLLAIPHYVIIGVLTNGWWGWNIGGAHNLRITPLGGGILSLLVFCAAVVLLVTGRYVQGLFDVIVGFNRWIYRVIAYAALMTDRYPPFRLDQGGSEPAPLPGPTPPGLPSSSHAAPSVSSSS